MDSLITSTTTVVLAIVALAVLAVVLSRNSQTGNVISSIGTAFTGSLGAAESPLSAAL